MADGDGGGNTGVLAILVIFIIVVVLAFLAWRGGMFGGSKTTNIKVEAPAPASH